MKLSRLEQNLTANLAISKFVSQTILALIWTAINTMSTAAAMVMESAECTDEELEDLWKQLEDGRY